MAPTAKIDTLQTIEIAEGVQIHLRPAGPCVRMAAYTLDLLYSILAMIIIGYSNGTKLQICVYLTSIYAGMLNYGKIFGVMASVIAVAGGIGPLVGGMIYDLSGEYDLLIFAGIPTSVIAGLLLLRLGPYPGWAPSRAARRPEAAPA